MAKTGFANPDFTGLNDRANSSWFSKPQAIFDFFIMSHRFPTLAAGFFGFTGVVLGALGAHELRVALVQQGTQHAWETAVHYHLIHSIALLGAAIWLKLPSTGNSRSMLWAARAWCAGILFFCGSLYGLALGGPRFLGPVTPLGGIAFLVGWGLVIATALKRDSSAKS